MAVLQTVSSSSATAPHVDSTRSAAADPRHRILDRALATGGSLRGICVLFEIVTDAAARYAYGPHPQRFPTGPTLRP